MTLDGLRARARVARGESRRAPHWLRAIGFATFLAIAPPGGAGAAAPDYESAVRPFLDHALDPSAVGDVRGASLRRDAARFTFEAGTIVLGAPVNGRVRSAAFVGSGTFTLAPPTAFERAELERFMGDTSLVRRFTRVVMLFTDSTSDELGGLARPGSGPVPAAARDGLEELLELVGDRKSGWVSASLARPLLGNTARESFIALLWCETGERLIFEIDPSLREDALFWRVPRGFLRFFTLADRDLVCQFRTGAREDSSRAGDAEREVHLSHTRVSARITDNLRFSAMAELRVRPAGTPEEWFRLRLFDELDVDSTQWADGEPAIFFRARKSQDLWVRGRAGDAPADHDRLRVWYRGDLIHNVADWMFLRSSTRWYPIPDGGQRATFDLEFESPSRFYLGAAGERVESRRQGEIIVSHWRIRHPATNATFVIGRFEERTVRNDDAPPVHGLRFKGKPDRVVWKQGDVSVVMGSVIEDWVIDDAARCMAFFGRVYGPAAVDALRIAQIPALHGEAFPGLVNFPETAFAGPNAAAHDQVFRAHEIAHQWWGHGVKAATYHDHWLVEGFANYSGLWYLQHGLGHGKDYLEVLEDWRGRLFLDRGTRPQGGRQAGPIWLGQRNSTMARPGDYFLIDYLKGAWVLHMLRSMMLDLQTMDDAPFTRLMSDFYAAHVGGTASTEDFRRAAEAQSGMELGWFFDQWVYGVAVPTYEFAHRLERTGDGRHAVRCRVRQRGVPDHFTMPVILRLQFGKDRFAWVRRVVSGPEMEFTLPPTEERPTDVVFNDVHSVLAEVRNVSW